jgi:hypothetical protein
MKIALCGTRGTGLYTLIDKQDFEQVSKLKLYFSPHGYACDCKGNKLHILILGDAPKNFNWDHKNGNKLDNRRSNLRLVTISQNRINNGGCKTSNHPKGVYPRSFSTKWQAVLRSNGTAMSSSHATMEEAMVAYDEMVREHYGEFGRYHYPKRGERGMDGKIRR